MEQQTAHITCPSCWECLEILVDPYHESGVTEHSYIEDCQVCCNPMQIIVTFIPDREFSIEVQPGQ